jgi:hypothetical protein
VIGQFAASSTCSNANHRRTDPPVSHCPTCGELVNARIPRSQCTEREHAPARRERWPYCADCGEQLIFDR